MTLDKTPHNKRAGTKRETRETGRHRGLPLRRRNIEMTSNPSIYHRRSIRLQGYDYSQAGAYFITICTQNREPVFGDIFPVGAGPCACPAMVLNDAGKMVQTVWDEIPFHYIGSEIGEFVVMPNHIHGIVIIVGATPPRGCPVSSPRCCPGVGQGNMGALSLGDIVHRSKSMTTKRYADGVKQLCWRPFSGRLWQRNYWEHVIRDEMELNRIREYIHNNPAKWESDRLNLNNGGPVCSNMVRQPVATYTTEGWMA